ncbi:MAG: DUF1684 domain-containing protein [Flavobacteriaceae bacterium]
MLNLSCKQEKKYHDTQQNKVEQIGSQAIKEILEFQKKTNADFKNPETSPLPDKYRAIFEGLDFFPPDTTYIVTAKFVRTPEALPFLMPTNTDRKSEEVVFGIAYFELQNKAYQLEVYQTQELLEKEEYKDYLFLPFTDRTNGETTYMGGRYLDLSIPEGDTLVLNFNKAYNPYCAYNKKFSCPIVPSVNALDVEIKAGLKAFGPKEK